MRYMYKGYIMILFAVGLLLAGCRNGAASQQQQVASGGVEYARWLSIEQCDGYTRIDVKNPWNEGAVLQTYMLVPQGAELPDGAKSGGTVVRTPLRSALVYSSVHGGVIKELGELQSITGVCDVQYFDMPEVKKGVEEGRIVDAGNSMQPTLEKVVQLRPDAIILSPFQNGGYGALTNMGIPIIECADYMENTPLGRAEWIKLFGELYGRRAEADSIFESVERRYMGLKSLADSVVERPTVISETVTSGVWYVPGGDSYMAHLYVDAGACYPWQENGSTGSLSLSFEQVYDRAHDADVWLVKSLNEMTLGEFAAQYPLNAEFKAFKERRVYQCPTMRTTLYQDFPFHPDVLLEEYIKIFHPGLLPDSTRYFFLMADE